MTRIVIESLSAAPVDTQPIEFVERKGLGHPDTICDSLAETMSQALCRAYLAVAGRVLHYNVENAFLVSGSTSPALGGGSVDRPMRFVYGDSATTEFGETKIPVRDIAEDAARRWFQEHLPLVDPNRHVLFQDELRPGSIQLSDIFDREEVSSNDTCFGCGYAPLSETEELVLTLEQLVNSVAFKSRFPETGQDVKVTAVRTGRDLSLTISLAFIGAELPTERAYFDRKAQVSGELERFARARLRDLDSVDVTINTLDRPGRGTSGMYLTVLGTSAEGADGGEVGRGNRPSGVNSYHRPLATGAVAGKNPVSNVGKTYNLFAGELARVIHREVEALEEVYVSLCSRIGEPVARPHLVSVRTVPTAAPDVRETVGGIVEREVDRIPSFVERLVTDPLPVC